MVICEYQQILISSQSDQSASPSPPRISAITEQGKPKQTKQFHPPWPLYLHCALYASTKRIKAGHMIDRLCTESSLPFNDPKIDFCLRVTDGDFRSSHTGDAMRCDLNYLESTFSFILCRFSGSGYCSAWSKLFAI